MFFRIVPNILTQSLWRDEAFSVVLSNLPLSQIISVTINDFNPPLYYLILAGWMQVVGSSEIAVRLLSIIFFVFTGVCVFFIAKKLYSRRVGIFAALFVLGNPFFFYYAFEVRMYTLLSFLVSLSFYFLFSKKWALFVLVALLGLYTHNFMVIALIVELIAAFIYWNNFSKHLKPLVLSLFTISIGYIPWLVIVLRQVSEVSSQFWIEKTTWGHMFTFFGELILDGAVTSFDVRFIIGFGFWVALLVILYRFFVLKIERDRTFLSLAFFTILPVLLTYAISQVATPLFVPRYLIFVVIPFSLLLAVLISRMGAVNITWLFFSCVFCSFLFLNLKIFKKTHKMDTRSTINNIASTWNGEPLVCHTILDFYQVKYYAQRIFDSVPTTYVLSSGVAPYAGASLLGEGDVIDSRPQGDYFYIIRETILFCEGQACVDFQP